MCVRQPCLCVCLSVPLSLCMSLPDTAPSGACVLCVLNLNPFVNTPPLSGQPETDSRQRTGAGTWHTPTIIVVCCCLLFVERDISPCATATYPALDSAEPLARLVWLSGQLCVGGPKEHHQLTSTRHLTHSSSTCCLWRQHGRKRWNTTRGRFFPTRRRTGRFSRFC